MDGEKERGPEGWEEGEHGRGMEGRRVGQMEGEKEGRAEGWKKVSVVRDALRDARPGMEPLATFQQLRALTNWHAAACKL